MNKEFYIPPDCADLSIAGEQYSIASDPNFPATKATIKVAPVPEVPPVPEQ